MSQEFPTTEVLAMHILAVDKDEIIKKLICAMESSKKTYTCLVNAYSTVLFHLNLEFQRAISSADFVIADGLPLAWVSRLKGQKIERLRGSDLLLTICELSQEHSFSHFLYGGQTAIAEKLSAILRHKYPMLNVVGTYSPPNQPVGYKEDDVIIEKINTLNPDILWVGLGAPKQEIWMYDHRERLDVPMIIGVGAAFDFLSDNIKSAPKLMQNAGFEWLFRLISEPRRMWRRYLWGNSLFLMIFVLDLLKVSTKKPIQ